jgi:imidazole glycerol-phosphate synthase subunit HisH
MPTPPNTVHIVRTGTANLASVRAAFARLSRPTLDTTDPHTVESAPALVLPGVGAFSAAMTELRASNLVEPLRARIAAGRPTLCVCLGLQLLADSSDESPGETGLSILPARVRRFTGPVRVPQFGWNTIAPDAACRVLSAGAVYYANSYRLLPADIPPDWGVATTDYAGPFVGAIERGPVLACQFHPELSGRFGSDLLARWLAAADACQAPEPARC